MPILVLFLCLVAQDAYAYFDPGTGSLLIQILLAVVGSVVLFYHSIRQALSKIAEKIRTFGRKN